MQIRTLVDDFAAQLSRLIEGETLSRARTAVTKALGLAPGGGARRGRQPATVHLTRGKPRRKAPLQLCPVPGCKNPAAPVFGMVCAKHKDLPKTKIKKFREARKAKKLKAAKAKG